MFKYDICLKQENENGNHTIIQSDVEDMRIPALNELIHITDRANQIIESYKVVEINNYILVNTGTGRKIEIVIYVEEIKN